MSNILAIFGATGKQGNSIINHVLNTPALSNRYTLRAITRDISSTKAQQLISKNIEVVSGDAKDPSSLAAALTNAHTVFAMTTPTFSPDALEIEYVHAKNIADAAVSQDVQYLIFSTLPSISDISHGKYTMLGPFDAKAEAETYIRTLPIKSAFYSPGSFMENFLEQAGWLPEKLPDGTWELRQHVSPGTNFPLIDAAGDTGKFVGAMLQDPEKFVGRTVCAATGMYDLDDIARSMGEVMGEKVVYRQVSVEELRQGLRARFPPAFAGMVEVVVQLFSYIEEFGYYGPRTEEAVQRAVGNVEGELTSLKVFLRGHGFQIK